MKALIVVLALAATACAYHNPVEPAYVPPTVSTAPASIRLTAATRSDSKLDITATVLTADNRFVSGVVVTFASSGGTFNPPVWISDASGAARSIFANTGFAEVTATAGDLHTTMTVVGTVPLPTPAPPPPTTIPTPPTPTPTAILNVSSTGTAGTAMGFGVSAPALGETWTWTFGDGATTQTTAFTTSHTYLAAGTYTATVSAPGVTGAQAVITITPPKGT